MDDIELVFQNCRTYNRDDAEEYQCGVRLEKYFKKEARRMGILVEQENAEPGSDTAVAPPKGKKPRRTL